MGHSRFAPSSTEREYQCPASFLLNEREEDTQSFDAAHGTAAHHIHELCLRNDHDTVFYAGCLVAVTATGDCRFVHETAPTRDDEMAFEVDDEMCAAVQSSIDWCREVGGDHFVEVRVEHTPWCPDFDEWGDPLGPQFGTSDHVACEPGVLTITDLKYGKGVKVYAERNRQAIKYALGVWLEYNWIYDFHTIRIRIAQPRLDHFDSWEISVEELLAEGEDIKARLTLVWDENAPFGPGEKQCRFCKVSGRCRAQDEKFKSTHALKFDDEEDAKVVDRTLLSIEELIAAYEMHALYVMRYEAIEREILRAGLRGEETPGFKVVAANTHRKWSDESTAREKLLKMGLPKTAVVTEKLVSPNQAEKLLSKEKREEIAGLWIKPSGGPCIVPLGDKRDPFAGANAEFEDEEFDDGFNS